MTKLNTKAKVEIKILINKMKTNRIKMRILYRIRTLSKSQNKEDYVTLLRQVISRLVRTKILAIISELTPKQRRLIQHIYFQVILEKETEEMRNLKMKIRERSKLWITKRKSQKRRL
jgi:hypothetical protein